MFQGFYGQGIASRPHQALARAIFTHDTVQSHASLLQLGLVMTHHMDAELFEGTILNHNENPEAVAQAMSQAKTSEERDQIRAWVKDASAKHKLADLMARNTFQFQLPPPPPPLPITAASTPMLPTTPLLPKLSESLAGFLNDFLSMSEDEDDPMTPAISSSLPSSPSNHQEEEQPPSKVEGVVEDMFPNPLPPNDEAHQYFYTLYFRVVGARCLIKCLGNVKVNNIKERVVVRKMERFIEAHWLACQWVKERGAAALTKEAFRYLYGRGCGPAGAYGPDAALIKTTRQAHVMRERPLEVLERVYPRAHWRPEHVPMALLEKLGPTPRILQPQMEEGEVTTYGWAPFANISPATHSLYYGVVYVLNQCLRTLMSKKNMAPAVSYAMWTYYVSWTELFVHCTQRMDDAYLKLPVGSYVSRDGTHVYGDGASPWSLWGTCDTRTFCAGDLPDYFAMLATIPLRGDQHIPSYFLGKLYQKALPFAGMRRHIIKLAVKCMLDHPPFWKLFSKLMWVMLANLYPGELAGSYDRLGMRSLLRIHELCNNRDMLMGTLLAQQPGMKDLLVRKELKESNDVFLQQVTRAGKPGGGSNGGPLIVSTMFRLHILYMGSFNPVYVERARKLIDWDYHKKDAVRLANIIRQHGLWAQDAFAQVRIDLGKTVKSPHSHVHRIRKHSVVVTLRERMDDAIEKVILRNRYDLLKDTESLRSILSKPAPEQSALFFSNTRCGEEAKKRGLVEVTREVIELALSLAEATASRYDEELDLPVKSAILNALICVEPEQRLSRITFAGLLLQPEYGSMTPRGVELMWKLVLVASDKAAPKDFARFMNAFDVHDLLVATYYFNAVALLEKIHFVPLDKDTVERTEQIKGSSETAYEVAISLCCDKVCSIMGQEKYGNLRVAFDLEKKQLVCVHNKPTATNYDDDDDDDDPPPLDADSNDDEDDDAEDDNDDDDEADHDHVVLQQVVAQNEEVEILDNEIIEALDDEGVVGGGAGDLIGDAIVMGGKGAKKVKVMQDRKIIRNQRKQFSKVPCGQPVLMVSLRGRALIWGNLRDKRVQIMFCPQCGGLHMYTIFGFSTLEDPHKPGPYRCIECMRAELTHVPYVTCAYCAKPAKEHLDIMDQQTMQKMPFCDNHFKIASRYHKRMNRKDLWDVFKYVQERRALRRAARGLKK